MILWPQIIFFLGGSNKLCIISVLGLMCFIIYSYWFSLHMQTRWHLWMKLSLSTECLLNFITLISIISWNNLNIWPKVVDKTEGGLNLACLLTYACIIVIPHPLQADPQRREFAHDKQKTTNYAMQNSYNIYVLILSSYIP